MKSPNNILPIHAISLLDGRNRSKVEEASFYFSEFALMKYRIRIEVSYLIFLSQNKIFRKLSEEEKKVLHNLWKKFSEEDALDIKKYESVVNHDVKAVEYFITDRCKKNSMSDCIPFIHIGLTSYDINIPAYALMLSDFRENVYTQKIENILARLEELIEKTSKMVLLGRTHGQPALPTTMGKELAVFYARVKKELNIARTVPIEGKLTGAVGNFNALAFVYPSVDWIKLSKKFITSLGLVPNVVTTQILPYDSWLIFFDSCKRMNNILTNFVQDMWWYISFEYFSQKKMEKEVGSSTMAHKINPITFENAEGNLQLANSLFEFFVRKLSISRLQRDLSDSTVKRNFGVAFGYTLLAFDSILSGLDRISPNSKKMKSDLETHWEIFSEGVQTYLRSRGFSQAYELLKTKTRGNSYTKEEFYTLIDELPIPREDKIKLKISSLSQYSGIPEKIIKEALFK